MNTNEHEQTLACPFQRENASGTAVTNEIRFKSSAKQEGTSNRQPIQANFFARRCRTYEHDAIPPTTHVVSANAYIVDAQQLRRISGKRTASAVRRWASAQGIHVRDGKHGPWTTVQAINKALGVASTHDSAYKPEDII